MAEANYGRHAAPAPETIEGSMQQLVLAIQDHLTAIKEMELGSADRLDQTFLFAASDHGEMIRIHPFIDGNGRWARVATNAFLFDADLRAGTIIRKREKAQYIAALDSWIERRAPGELRDQLLAGYVRELWRRH